MVGGGGVVYLHFRAVEAFFSPPLYWGYFIWEGGIFQILFGFSNETATFNTIAKGTKIVSSRTIILAKNIAIYPQIQIPFNPVLALGHHFSVWRLFWGRKHNCDIQNVSSFFFYSPQTRNAVVKCFPPHSQVESTWRGVRRTSDLVPLSASASLSPGSRGPMEDPPSKKRTAGRQLRKDDADDDDEAAPAARRWWHFLRLELGV